MGTGVVGFGASPLGRCPRAKLRPEVTVAVTVIECIGDSRPRRRDADELVFSRGCHCDL